MLHCYSRPSQCESYPYTEMKMEHYFCHRYTSVFNSSQSCCHHIVCPKFYASMDRIVVYLFIYYIMGVQFGILPSNYVKLEQHVVVVHDDDDDFIIDL